MNYEALGAEIGRLVEEKQSAYGDSFGRSGAVMRILYPDGIPPEKLDDALAVVRVIDKLFRIATDRDALGESPWRDTAGYGLLGGARPRSPDSTATDPGWVPVPGREWESDFDDSRHPEFKTSLAIGPEYRIVPTGGFNAVTGFRGYRLERRA